MADQPNTQVPFVDSRQAALWGVVNALQQKFALEGAYLKSQFPDGNFEPVPFGSTIVNILQPSPEKAVEQSTSVAKPETIKQPEVVVQENSSGGVSKLVQGLILTAGLLGSGLGLAAFLKPDKVTETTVVDNKDLEPKIIEGILEWDFNSDNGLKLKQDGSKSDIRGFGPETNGESRKKSTGIAKKI